LKSFIAAERPLTKILNKTGQRVDPCVTPEKTEKGDENFPKMRKKEDLFNK
jgi:hypothetical protein